MGSKFYLVKMFKNVKIKDNFNKRIFKVMFLNIRMFLRH